MALSASLHLVVWALVTFVLRAPSLDVEFELPMDVELGTAEALSPAQPASSAPTPTPVPPPRAAGEGELDAGTADASLADAGHDGGTYEAAVVDAGGPPGDAGVTRPKRVRDAGGNPLASLDAGTSTLPPGAQIAVRVDMGRVRASPIANDVRGLLTAIPDWKALLEGSGVDPVDQLERLLIATPNLQREKILLAGRYRGGEQIVRAAVTQLAARKAVDENWHAEGSVRVATWANADATPRVIALVGPAHFAIARPEDLPRVLAIAGARAQRKAARGAQHPADALLSMGDGEALSVEVEGAARFVRRASRGVPERLRLAARELAGKRIELRGQLTYGGSDGAEDARAYLMELKERYARNALVMLLGLGGPLGRTQIVRTEQTVDVTLELSVEQTRLVLGYVRELLRPRAPPP